MNISAGGARRGHRAVVTGWIPEPTPEACQVAPELMSDAIRTGATFAFWWLGARQLREELFGSALSSDACWYILLDLYQAHASGKKVSITSLSPMIGSPHSTAGRRTRALIGEGLLIRSEDPTDRRRAYVELGPEVAGLMCLYFTRLAERGGPPRLAP